MKQIICPYCKSKDIANNCGETCNEYRYACCDCLEDFNI